MRMLRGHWQLLALAAVVFGLWQTPVVVPLKILIVFLHELAHALVGLATGATIVDMGLSAQQGGHVIMRGGARFWTLTAGYLGSLVIGIGLLLAATRSRLDRAVLGVLGAVMVAVALLYLRDLFALAFTLGAGIAMLAAARFLPATVSDVTLRVIGISSLFYVPYDIISDTILRSNLQSDARMLAEEFGGTTMLWGGLWLILALGAIYWCLRHGLGENSNLRRPKTNR
ncbi:hypothetical protein ACMU_17235 [Actibacterium mucosum KCTC 23349]|uniref:Peptidase M50 n=1 Tax=Actibacterium mucosum KCTC 23349 TaxID=1454373 RepID=A0A037ZEB0_9RHOB|nr:M50 family metallopeptidase [Actibacterium mucosum]KAJ54452.1 hypothetical protein ACMU_17235 [Actibacterium mucosum KCTC 23349]